MRVSTQAYPGEPPKGEPVHFIQRGFCIPRTAASSQVGGDPHLFHQLDAGPRAETLEQKLIEQAGTDQGGIKRRNVAKIVVVEIQLHAGMRLYAYCEKAASQSRSGGGNRGISPGVVELRRLVNRKAPPIGKRVFKENKRAISLPFHHSERHTGRAAV